MGENQRKKKAGRPAKSFTTTNVKMADLIGAVNVHGTVAVGTIWARGLGLIKERDGVDDPKGCEGAKIQG